MLDKRVSLAFPFNFLPDRKGRLNFGRLLIEGCFLYLSSLAVLGSSWESDDKEPASLPSRSLGDTGFDLRLRCSRFPDLTASGTCFWVRNRLSPESLQTQVHKSNWSTSQGAVSSLGHVRGSHPHLSAPAISLDTLSRPTEDSRYRDIFFT